MRTNPPNRRKAHQGTASVLSTEATTLSTEVSDFLGAMSSLGESQQLRTYAGDGDATRTTQRTSEGAGQWQRFF